MAQLDDGNGNRPMSGAGVGVIDDEEEEQVRYDADSTPGPSSSAVQRVDEAEPSPSISSASDFGDVLTLPLMCVWDCVPTLWLWPPVQAELGQLGRLCITLPPG